MVRFMRSAIAAVAIVPLLILAACASGPTSAPPSITAPATAPAPVPTPAPTPAPEPAARPGDIVFTADLAHITIGLAFSEDVPPVCTAAPGAAFLTFDREGTQGDACAQPLPNPCASIDASGFHFTAPPPGWPLFTPQTFAKDAPLSVEAVIDAAQFPGADGFYAGPGIYNGEKNYRTLYEDQAGLAMYGPTWLKRLGQLSPGPHALRIDSDGAGVITYFADGQPLWTEHPGDSPDSSIFANNPRGTLFWGGAVGTVTRFDIAAAPKS